MLKALKLNGHRDSLYRFPDIIELDDALVGGKKSGKRGRGTEGKVSVLIACENRDEKPGFIAMEVIDSVSKKICRFCQVRRRVKARQIVCSDDYPANYILEHHVTQIAKVTPPGKATEWLPWVHNVIVNLKRFLLATFHGTSKVYLQESLDEVFYRFNRRF